MCIIEKMMYRRFFFLLISLTFSGLGVSQTSVVLDSSFVKECLNGAWKYLEEPGKADSAVWLIRPALKAKPEEIGENRFYRMVYTLYIAYRENDQIDSALVYGEKATAGFLGLRDTLYSGVLMRCLAEDYTARGLYSKAIGHLHLATQMLEEKKDTSTLLGVVSVRTLLFKDMGECKQGIAYGEEVLPMAQSYLETSGNPAASIYYLHLLSAIALNYQGVGKPKKAIDYLRMGENLIDQLPDSGYLTQNFEIMGEVLMEIGAYPEAEKYFQRALFMDRQAFFTIGVASHLSNLGHVAILKGELNKAQEYLLEAETLALKLDNIEVLKDVYQYWFLYNQAAGELERALESLQKHHHLKDSILNIEKLKVIDELEARFETQKKDAELAQKRITISNQALRLERNTLGLLGLGGLVVLLVGAGFLWRLRVQKQQAWARKQQELELRATRLSAMIDSQEQERMRYSTDLHDGFGQLISVLRMNLKAFAETPTKPKLLDQSVTVLDGMYDELQAICFNMMPRVLVKDGLVDALKEFARRVGAAGKVTLSVGAFGMEKRLPERHEVALYRIVQEWVNNILKHGDGDAIELQLVCDEKEITLTVEDNGSGFDPAALEHGTGNGWKNIHYRSHLIQGELELDTRPDAKGSTLILNVPLIGVIGETPSA